MQLTYTIFLGQIAKSLSTTFLCIPDLGGSTIIVSGVPFSSKNSLFRTLRISPQKKVTFFIEFSFLFSSAALTASLTHSIPITFFACSEMNIEIVPIPEYKSYTISLDLTSANFLTILYSSFVWSEFV